MSDPHIITERPKPQEILQRINIPVGSHIKLIKREHRTDFVITKSAVIEGKLAAPLHAGQQVALDNKNQLGVITDAMESDGRVFLKTDTGRYELLQHFEPEFGDYGVKVGDLDEAGFVAFNSNHSSNQDAFAVNDTRTMFAVSDGIGSNAQSGAVSRWIVRKLVEELNDLNDLQPEWVDRKLSELFRDKQFLAKYIKTGHHISDGGAATLTAVRKISDNEFHAFVLGDSPLYVIDAAGAIVQSVGADSAGSLEVPGDFGFNVQGQIKMHGMPERRKIKLNPGERLVIGSDYLSDGLLTYGDKTEADIARFETYKRDGGFYAIGVKRFAGSELSDAQKSTADFITWNPGIENTLNSAKNGLRAYQTAIKAPQTYRAHVKDNPDALKQFEGWMKIAGRNLQQFAAMKTGEEFYRAVSGSDAWKKDDATVVIIK